MARLGEFPSTLPRDVINVHPSPLPPYGDPGDDAGDRYGVKV